MTRFQMFIALDGHGLNGFEGYAGVARLDCDPDTGRYEPHVAFFPGVAGGHATQLNPSGTLGFLGNLSQTLLFYHPGSLEEVARHSTLSRVCPDVGYSSQTHVVWLNDDELITVMGPNFVRLRVGALDAPEIIGPHGVTLPHAIKRSPSGRYLFYGAMDHDAHGYARQTGIFDLQTGKARVVELPATVWHLGVHPSRDVFYAPSQGCLAQDGGEFSEYAMAHFKNYLFEVDGPSARVLRHAALPREAPAFLTSDVVVTEREVLYNSCASSTITRVDLDTLSRVSHIDERTPLRAGWRYWRTAVENVKEAATRSNVITSLHHLAKALRITGGNLLDGSYGLQLSPDRRYLLSAHRGRNEVIVYRYPQATVAARIAFPPIQAYIPGISRLADPRLGFHHSALLELVQLGQEVVGLGEAVDAA